MSEFSGKVETILDEAAFQAIVSSSSLAVLYFYAAWNEDSGPGAQMNTVFSVLASKYGEKIRFIKIEAETCASLSTKHKVTVVPTFIALHGLKEFARVEGANPPEMNKMVSTLSQMTSPTGTSKEQEQPKLAPAIEARLRHILASSPSLLFMKGTPEAPRCGFSRKIVELLKSNDVPFASFDILVDEDVRQGLKVLSDWPTYPQYYVKGELIGGLDIVTEMSAQGDLKAQFGIDSIQFLQPPEPLEMRLRKLTTQAPVVIFIKGTPDVPRCGFTKSLLAILAEEGIDYASFDILNDEEVRQGLKTFSDWPTYPQVYANGNFMGGLDIIKEMRANGPLVEQLK